MAPAIVAAGIHLLPQPSVELTQVPRNLPETIAPRTTIACRHMMHSALMNHDVIIKAHSDCARLTRVNAVQENYYQ